MNARVTIIERRDEISSTGSRNPLTRAPLTVVRTYLRARNIPASERFAIPQQWTLLASAGSSLNTDISLLTRVHTALAGAQRCCQPHEGEIYAQPRRCVLHRVATTTAVPTVSPTATVSSIVCSMIGVPHYGAFGLTALAMSIHDVVSAQLHAANVLRIVDAAIRALYVPTEQALSFALRDRAGLGLADAKGWIV
jgi:hypothetical protein